MRQTDEVPASGCRTGFAIADKIANRRLINQGLRGGRWLIRLEITGARHGLPGK